MSIREKTLETHKGSLSGTAQSGACQCPARLQEAKPGQNGPRPKATFFGFRGTKAAFAVPIQLDGLVPTFITFILQPQRRQTDDSKFTHCSSRLLQAQDETWRQFSLLSLPILLTCPVHDNRAATPSTQSHRHRHRHRLYSLYKFGLH